MARSPTVSIRDSRGYDYVETAPWWNDMCAEFPCFSALKWPNYRTVVLHNQLIDGERVTIQLWKGNCQKFLGLRDFPGGTGGEVGIYRPQPGRRVPNAGGALPPGMQAMMRLAETLGNDQLWWPHTEFRAPLSFELVNPNNGQVVFGTDTERDDYWLTRWMNPRSWDRYRRDHRGQLPTWSGALTMRARIAGRTYTWGRGDEVQIS